MNEQAYIIIHSPNHWSPAAVYADTVFETTKQTRLLDANGQPYEYKRQKLGFDLSGKGRA